MREEAEVTASPTIPSTGQRTGPWLSLNNLALNPDSTFCKWPWKETPSPSAPCPCLQEGITCWQPMEPGAGLGRQPDTWQVVNTCWPPGLQGGPAWLPTMRTPAPTASPGCPPVSVPVLDGYTWGCWWQWGCLSGMSVGILSPGSVQAETQVTELMS